MGRRKLIGRKVGFKGINGVPCNSIGTPQIGGGRLAQLDQFAYLRNLNGSVDSPGVFIIDIVDQI